MNNQNELETILNQYLGVGRYPFSNDELSDIKKELIMILNKYQNNLINNELDFCLTQDFEFNQEWMLGDTPLNDNECLVDFKQYKYITLYQKSIIQ